MKILKTQTNGYPNIVIVTESQSQYSVGPFGIKLLSGEPVANAEDIFAGAVAEKKAELDAAGNGEY